MCKNAELYTAHLYFTFNPLNAELIPICYLLALLGAHHILHVSRIRVKLIEGALEQR
jgi:hypothetical protein